MKNLKCFLNAFVVSTLAVILTLQGCCPLPLASTETPTTEISELTYSVSKSLDEIEFDRVVEYHGKQYHARIIDFNEIGRITNGEFIAKIKQGLPGFKIETRETKAELTFVEYEGTDNQSEYALRILKEKNEGNYSREAKYSELDIKIPISPGSSTEISEIMIVYSFHNDANQYRPTLDEQLRESYMFVSLYCGSNEPGNLYKFNFGPHEVSKDVLPKSSVVKFLDGLSEDVPESQSDDGRTFYSWTTKHFDVSFIGPDSSSHENVRLHINRNRNVPINYLSTSPDGTLEYLATPYPIDIKHSDYYIPSCSKLTGDISVGVKLMNKWGLDLRIYKIIIILDKVK